MTFLCVLCLQNLWVLKRFDLHNRSRTVACRKQRNYKIFFLSKRRRISQKDTFTMNYWLHIWQDWTLNSRGNDDFTSPDASSTREICVGLSSSKATWEDWSRQREEMIYNHGKENKQKLDAMYVTNDSNRKGLTMYFSQNAYLGLLSRSSLVTKEQYNLTVRLEQQDSLGSYCSTFIFHYRQIMIVPPGKTVRTLQTDES